MMLPFALLLAAPQANAAPPMAPPIAVPTDWSAMPPLPWRTEPAITPDLVAFVEGEVQAGRCATSRPGIELALAVYVRADGFVRAVVPRAIDCPTVEQFAAGLVTSFARNNLRTPAAGWYRATIAFDWSR